MYKLLKLTIVLSLVLASVPVLPALAQAENLCNYSGIHANGAKYCITLPPPGFWNGDLVIFAHGFVPVTEPVDIPWDQMNLPGGITLPVFANSLGYAFATTSYSENGLAIVRGVIDILDLVEVFNDTVGTPNRVLLLGVSEGGLVTTLAVEKHPGVFDGGMALCGPIGDFRGQINYFGDFRVLFDYFMPGLLPPSPVDIPQNVVNNWDVFAFNIFLAISNPANAAQVTQLLNVSQAPVDPANPNTVAETTLGILRYNVLATNNAKEKLNGQPFDNQHRVYVGSFNDALLNLGVQRFTADKIPLNRIDKKYETSGALKKPLVTMHTTGDPIVPYWHSTLYTGKAAANGKGGSYIPITVQRYGHCTFTLPEMLNAFGALVFQTSGQALNTAGLPLNSAGANEFYNPAERAMPGK